MQVKPEAGWLESIACVGMGLEKEEEGRGKRKRKKGSVCTSNDAGFSSTHRLHEAPVNSLVGTWHMRNLSDPSAHFTHGSGEMLMCKHPLIQACYVEVQVERQRHAPFADHVARLHA